MKKHVSHIILSLGILLLAGYSQVYAHATADPRSSQTGSYAITQTGFSTPQGDAPLIARSSPPDWNAVAFILEVTEVKEEEDGPHEKLRLKKKPRGNYSTFIFRDQTQVHFFNTLRTLQPSSQSPDRSSNKRFLILQVFRI